MYCRFLGGTNGSLLTIETIFSCIGLIIGAGGINSKLDIDGGFRFWGGICSTVVMLVARVIAPPITIFLNKSLVIVAVSG